VRIEPGTYTIEVWANPSELTPSPNPRVPAETVPTDRIECPDEAEFQFGF
jgi:hypothetical protein